MEREDFFADKTHIKSIPTSKFSLQGLEQCLQHVFKVKDSARGQGNGRIQRLHSLKLDKMCKAKVYAETLLQAHVFFAVICRTKSVYLAAWVI